MMKTTATDYLVCLLFVSTVVLSFALFYVLQRPTPEPVVKECVDSIVRYKNKCGELSKMQCLVQRGYWM